MGISFASDTPSPFVVTIDGVHHHFEIQQKTKLAVPSIMAEIVYDIAT
jgi:hypothetical protein